MAEHEALTLGVPGSSPGRPTTMEDHRVMTPADEKRTGPKGMGAGSSEVEQRTFNPPVAGSIPARLSTMLP